MIKQYIKLFRGLGMKVGKMMHTTQTDEDTGEVYRGYRIDISGTQILSKLNKVALTYKQCEDYERIETDKDWCFRVTPVQYQHPYIGVRTDGDNEFLLADSTVVHGSP